MRRCGMDLSGAGCRRRRRAMRNGFCRGRVGSLDGLPRFCCVALGCLLQGCFLRHRFCGCTGRGCRIRKLFHRHRCHLLRWCFLLDGTRDLLLGCLGMFELRFLTCLTRRFAGSFSGSLRLLAFLPLCAGNLLDTQNFTFRHGHAFRVTNQIGRAHV